MTRKIKGRKIRVGDTVRIRTSTTHPRNSYNYDLYYTVIECYELSGINKRSPERYRIMIHSAEGGWEYSYARLNEDEVVLAVQKPKRKITVNTRRSW